MPIYISRYDIDIVAGATPVTLPVTDNFQQYYINAAGITLLGNQTISPSGTAQEGMLFKFKFKGALTLGGNSFTVFGVSMPQNILNGDAEIDCYYNGSAWEVTALPSFTDAGIVSTSTIATNAVTSAKITDLNVTTAKINDLAVTTGKINDLAVTDAKIASNTITASKLDTAGKTETFTSLVSFETGYLGGGYKIYVPYACTATFVAISVTHAIAGVNDGSITVASSLGTIAGTPVTITQSAVVGTTFTSPLSDANAVIAADSYITITSAKVNAGGEVLVTITVERT